MAVMRQLVKKTARAMKRVRVDRAMATAKETRVTATMVVMMMANGTKDSARPHNNQLRGNENDNSKGNKEDEGSKDNGDSVYSDDVNERNHSSGDDGKRQQRQRKSTQHNNQPKAKMGTIRVVTTRATKVKVRMAYVRLVGLLPRIW
jgi:hypothetical protein